MIKFDERRIEELVKSIKQAILNNPKKEEFLNELTEIYKPIINTKIWQTARRMYNPNSQNLRHEAMSALYEGVLRFDETRHKSASIYLKNYIWEHLKTYAENDRPRRVPEESPDLTAKPIKQAIPEITEISADGITIPIAANPEQHAMFSEVIDRLNAIENTPYKGKRIPSMILVAIDMQENPDDMSVTSIAERTGLPKSTVSDALKKIFKLLTDDYRTNLN